MVAWTTAKRWEQRYREHGKDGMNDRPSRPRTSPNRTTTSVVKKIVSLRWRKRLGPVQIAYRPGLLKVWLTPGFMPPERRARSF